MRYVRDLDLPLEDVAEIFKKHDWLYAVGNCYGVPDANELGVHIWRLLASIDVDKDFIQSGRLALVRDQYNPSTFQVFLNLGYLYAEDEENDEVDEEAA